MAAPFEIDSADRTPSNAPKTRFIFPYLFFFCKLVHTGLLERSMNVNRIDTHRLLTRYRFSPSICRLNWLEITISS